MNKTDIKLQHISTVEHRKKMPYEILNELLHLGSMHMCDRYELTPLPHHPSNPIVENDQYKQKIVTTHNCTSVTPAFPHLFALMAL